MRAEVLALTGRQLQPPRSASAGAESALSDRSAQGALLSIKVGSQFLDYTHTHRGY